MRPSNEQQQRWAKVQFHMVMAVGVAFLLIGTVGFIVRAVMAP